MIIILQNRRAAINMHYVRGIYIISKDGKNFKLKAAIDGFKDETVIGEYDNERDAQVAFNSLCKEFDEYAYVLDTTTVKYTR